MSDDLDALEAAARAAFPSQPNAHRLWMTDGKLGTYYNLLPPGAALALIARVRRAEAALRTAAGLANEMSWKAGTRKYADRLANIIRSGFEERAALEGRNDG